MSKSKVPIQVVRSSSLAEDSLFLGERCVKLLKIPENRKIWLGFGSFRQQVSVISVPRFNGLRLQASLAQRMGLLPGMQLRVDYKPEIQTIRLGPSIGVLISRIEPESPDKPFGAITAFCQELADAAHTQGAYVTVFAPDNWSADHNTIDGWIYDGRWRKFASPVPEVISNRLTSRLLEDQPSVQFFMKDVKSRFQCSIFNEKFLNKTEVFQGLMNDENVQPYLPESYPFTGLKQLKMMCARHPVIFLKPIRGSLGNGIIRIARHQDGTVSCFKTTVNGVRKTTFPNVMKLFGSMAGKLRATKYQIQQGISLIENEGRPVDFRALTQKNGLGVWSVTSIVARIAGTQQFVSNLARGGSLSTVQEVVSAAVLPPGAKADAHTKLHQAALNIARSVDSRIPCHLGELGIDLALDKQGKVWLLEVNSKPSKNDATPIGEGKIRPSVRQLLQYARFLSGF